MGKLSRNEFPREMLRTRVTRPSRNALWSLRAESLILSEFEDLGFHYPSVQWRSAGRTLALCRGIIGTDMMPCNQESALFLAICRERFLRSAQQARREGLGVAQSRERLFNRLLAIPKKPALEFVKAS